MLRLVKWAYDLGIRQERVRIASHLQLASQQARSTNDAMMDMMRETPRMSKPRREKLDFSIAVNDRIQLIIQDMFESHGDWIPTASIMFPDDGHKGKVK